MRSWSVQICDSFFLSDNAKEDTFSRIFGSVNNAWRNEQN